MKSPANRDEIISKLKRSSEVSITVTGRRTRRRISTPVWFVLEGSNVVLVPTKGSDNDWFKNLEADPGIGLAVDDSETQSRATLVRDSKRVESVLNEFRTKYGSMWSESYYVKRDVCVEVHL